MTHDDTLAFTARLDDVLKIFAADLKELDARAAEFTNDSERIKYICGGLRLIMAKYKHPKGTT
jgi:hypothetical protein